MLVPAVHVPPPIAVAVPVYAVQFMETVMLAEVPAFPMNSKPVPKKVYDSELPFVAVETCHPPITEALIAGVQVELLY